MTNSDRRLSAIGSGAIEPCRANPGAAVRPTDAAPSTTHATPPGAVDTVTNALATGAIDPIAARGDLVADAVRAHLPATTPPAVAESLAREITMLLEEDPTLLALLS